MNQLIATAASFEAIQKMVNQYFYSDIELVGEPNEKVWLAKNKNGIIKNFHVIKKGKRFRFELMLN